MQQSLKTHIPSGSAMHRLHAGSRAPLASSHSVALIPSRRQLSRPSSPLLVRAEAEGDDDFESRLAALKRAKGETPYGEGVKKNTSSNSSSSSSSSSSTSTSTKGKKVYDFSDETLHFESGPHAGDVAVNLLLGTTLVWLPLSIAAVGRGVFVKYRFTDRRISVITTAPWKNEQLDAAYQEVKDVVTVGRGVGLWGDMVITLKDGSKIEMRALPEFLELKKYILQRRDELSGSGNGNSGGGNKGGDGGRGFSAPATTTTVSSS